MMMFDFPVSDDQQYFPTNNYDEIFDMLDFSFGKIHLSSLTFPFLPHSLPL
jgi:hypothetical protein